MDNTKLIKNMIIYIDTQQETNESEMIKRTSSCSFKDYNKPFIQVVLRMFLFVDTFVYS